MKRTIRNNDGFLLLEAVIYLALFLVFVGGVASSFYHLSFSDQDLSEEVLVIDEAEFVLKKINWLLSDTSKVLKPTPGETTEYLLIKDEFEKTTKIFLDNGLVVMEVDEEKIFLHDKKVVFENLRFFNHSDVPVQNFLVETSFMVGGRQFQSARFGYEKTN